MVKIPKAPKGKRLRFRDDKGRYVKESDRYQKATMVERKFRGKWHVISKGKRITPSALANLVPRDEFESLAANYSNPVNVPAKNRKYRAWELSNSLEKVRGLRGHMVKVTMNIMDGKRLRKISFYRRVRKKGSYSYGFFKQMNAAIGMEKMNLYNRIGNKLLPDRQGKTVRLMSIDVQKEL